MKQLLMLSLILCFFSIHNFGQEKKYSLDDLIHLAKENSPQLSAVKNQIEADKQRVGINSNLPDPQIAIGFTNIPVNSFSFTQEPMTGKMVSLTQSIPFPGKLNGIAEMNSYDELISGKQYNEEQNRISFLVRNLYFKIHYSLIEKRVEVDKRELLKALSEVLNSRYQNSLSTQKDVVLNDYQITLIDEKLIEIKTEQKNILSNLSILIDKELNISDIDFSQPIYAVDTSSTSLESNPTISKLNSMIEKSSKKIELTGYEFYPDFKFTIQYTQRDWIERTNTDLNDFVSFIIGFNLPLNFGGNKNATVQETEFTQKYLEEKQKSVKQDLEVRLTTAIQNYSSIIQRLKLTENQLIEKARLNYETTLAAYQTEKASFNDVISSINLLFNSKLKKEKLSTELEKTASEIIYLTGNDFKEIYK